MDACGWCFLTLWAATFALWQLERWAVYRTLDRLYTDLQEATRADLRPK